MLVCMLSLVAMLRSLVVLAWVSENFTPRSIAKATFDGANLTLEYYDQTGTGTFTR